jgi:hypothetical protein
MDFIKKITTNSNIQGLIFGLLASIGLCNIIQLNKVIRNQEALLKLNLAILNDTKMLLVFGKC